MSDALLGLLMLKYLLATILDGVRMSLPFVGEVMEAWGGQQFQMKSSGAAGIHSQMCDVPL